METPARDAFIKLFNNASLSRDASAPQDLTVPQKQELWNASGKLSVTIWSQSIISYAREGALHFITISKSFRKKIHEIAKQDIQRIFQKNLGSWNHIIEGKPIKFEPNLMCVVGEKDSYSARV
jgi:hypothetical protein